MIYYIKSSIRESLCILCFLTYGLENHLSVAIENQKGCDQKKSINAAGPVCFACVCRTFNKDDIRRYELPDMVLHGIEVLYWSGGETRC